MRKSLSSSRLHSSYHDFIFSGNSMFHRSVECTNLSLIQVRQVKVEEMCLKASPSCSESVSCLKTGGKMEGFITWWGILGKGQ